MRLTGKTAIVTAAGQGIGRATAERFRDEGARVWALDRDGDALSAVDGVDRLVIDLRDASAIAALPERTGPVDILANVAGFVAAGTVLECTDADWALSFDLSVNAAFRMIQAFLPTMLERGGGSIINMSSICSSVKAVPNRFAYGASKAAVIGLTKSVAIDYVTRGIRCNAICPGTIETPSLRDRMEAQAAEQGVSIDTTAAAFVARQPMGRLGRPEEIAALFAYLASDEAAFVTGTAQVIDGGWVN